MVLSLFVLGIDDNRTEAAGLLGRAAGSAAGCGLSGKGLASAAYDHAGGAREPEPLKGADVRVLQGSDAGEKLIHLMLARE